MILIRAIPRKLCPAPRTVLRALVGALAGLAVTACSNNYNLGVQPSLGIAINVALSVSGGVTSLDEGQVTVVVATVSNDVNNAGVTWSVLGPGTLVGATPTAVEYEAPASGVVGAVGAQITATSVANSANNATVTVVTLGSPVITPMPQFPANVNVPYEAQIAVVGGITPYSWTVLSGAVPPGLTFDDTATAVTTITGTPTAAGTYTFTAQVVDSTGATTTAPITLIVNPQSACLLSGQFTFTFSGYRGGGQATHIGNITINSVGGITGEQDYKDGHRTTPDETLYATSSCANRSTNTGVLELNAPSGEISYNFAATPPDANGVIHSARLQLIGNPGDQGAFEDSGTGEMLLTDPTALTAASPAGNFAFGVLGVDSNTVHYGTAGNLSTAANGTFNGLIDSNSGAAGAAAPLGTGLNGTTLGGTLSTPDADGRGVMTLQVGSASSELVYYIVNANKLLLMNIDAPINSPRENGSMTSQSGDVTPTTFDNGGLASPSIVSLWGLHGTVNPVGVVALGQLSSANPGAGTVSLILDSADQATDANGVIYPSQSYHVGPSGRGTLTLTGGGATRNFVFYLDGVSDGYIVEQTSVSGNAGLLETQTIPAGGFSDTLDGEFVGSTAFPQSPGPVVLLPLVQVSFGTLSSNAENGSFAIDPANGRGFGTVSVSGVGDTADALYIVSPTKVEVLSFATPLGINGSITWLVQN